MLRRVLDQFLERLAAATDFDSLLEAAASAVTPAEVDNTLVVSEARAGGAPALLAMLARRARRPMLVLTSSIERAEALTDGLAFFGAGPLLFPAFETLPFETGEPVLSIVATRNRVLSELARGKWHGRRRKGDPPAADPADLLIVAPVDSLAFRTLPREAQLRQSVHIAWGEPLDPEELAHRLAAMGYAREALVESPGEFSIRGSIIDVFPPETEWPWRLDLFGSELEQIRRFDPTTQRSLALETEIESIEILARACHEPKLEHLAADGELISPFDLLPPETLVVFDGPERVEQRMLRFAEVAQRHWADAHKGHRDEDDPNPLIHHGYEPGDWLLSADELRRACKAFQRLELEATPDDDESPARRRGCPRIALGTHTFEAMPAQFAEYLELFRERLRKGHRIMIVCDNNGQVMRLDELLRENELSAIAVDDDTPGRDLPAGALAPCPEVLLCVGQLHEGFQAPRAGLLIVTDHEMFGRYRKRHIYRKATRGKPIASPTEINRGDFVVHVEHGIGYFEGIRRQMVDGRTAELLELTYQDGDKLLVPVEKLNLVQKYAAADGKPPALDKLGGKRWARRKKKSMEAVRKMAGELLELYARREAAQGYAYGQDNTWLQEFEASFIYQETPDQLEAIGKTKADMMECRPMDRLVCGDVGFGKTEVAIRAAFKALVEGRQVAMLAPTTLLVQQHYTTFRERFAEYPFKVEMLSRFRSPTEVRDTLKRLKEGAVQMVIGTHRLLGRDVQFKDLGLLIVDEEQRFGVAQKEKIKSMRADVDILTLTATPIPRTLYMALSGLRDLSIINTPPADRQPIKTRTIRWDREHIEEAILRELNRGGQVFFVHNRIQTIDEVAQTLAEIVPQAKLAVAHGQMDEETLEQIMLDFVDGKYEILLSTTIIENGIDIPNVNTIIINRADTFGLAQLYQLRGRVGRDVRQAYAYLILPHGQAITPHAVKRLEALEEFTDLGVGFTIAMRDMEIRGTGNILGREQHGAITDVGFEMYCRLLDEAVGELRGVEGAGPLWPTEVKWPVDQLLPEDYIPVESQRIRFYKDLAGARGKSDLDLLLEELVDRYGEMPPPAINLVNACRLRLAAARWCVDTVRPGPDGTPRIAAPQYATELAGALAENASAAGGAFSRLRRNGQQIVLELRDVDDPDEAAVLAALARYFEALPDPEAARATA